MSMTTVAFGILAALFAHPGGLAHPSPAFLQASPVAVCADDGAGHDGSQGHQTRKAQSAAGKSGAGGFPFRLPSC